MRSEDLADRLESANKERRGEAETSPGTSRRPPPKKRQASRPAQADARSAWVQQQSRRQATLASGSVVPNQSEWWASHDCVSAAHLSQPDYQEFSARGPEKAEGKEKKYEARGAWLALAKKQ